MSGDPQPAPAPAPRKGSTLGRWLKRIAIALGLFLIVSGLLMGYAEHRTSQPDFCGSCHIMEPYYKTWHEDIHGGKHDIACVECHYAPGERTTVKAKLRGLSQLSSYISGRYGASRPRAHVDNQSCLTAKCHGDLLFMDKEINVGTVKFVHAKHLRANTEKLEKTEQELQALAATLRDRLGADRFAKLDEVAREASPAKERENRMAGLLEDWHLEVPAADLARFAELSHREVRLAQLNDLQCTNCHSYVAPDPTAKAAGPARHFTVKTTACFTCHFTNEAFNAGTGQCLLCHTLPDKPIPVHDVRPDDTARLKTPELGAKPVLMDHKMIAERKVDCIACHADVATENSRVTRRDCERCHDRPEYFKDANWPMSVEDARSYHAAHVPGQHAKCLDCHSEIHHQVARGKTETGQPAFLATVMSDCLACHPNQHSAQVSLLSGTGGAGVPKGVPNAMFGLRTNCLGCHTQQAATNHGGLALRAGTGGCIACHGDRHNATFKQWKAGLEQYTAEADEAFAKANKALDKAKDLSPETRAKAADLLAAARADLNLVKAGHGIHNVQYAMDLLDKVTQNSQKAASLMAKEAKKPAPTK